jgi:hypothetical protein
MRESDSGRYSFASCHRRAWIDLVEKQRLRRIREAGLEWRLLVPRASEFRLNGAIG